jgi:hypothetical protein
MGLKFSPNNTAGGALRFTTNQPGLLSSVYTVDWDNISNLPAALGGLSSLVDPNADRIIFWDDSAGSVQWLSVTSPMAISGTSLSVPNMVGDSGTGGTAGLVPAPAAGDAAATKFLKADGTWTTPSGSGDASGPSSATDNAITRFDGTTGKLLQNSVVTIADTTGAIAGTRSVAFSGSTSGAATVTAQATAGTPTLTLPNASGTFAVSVSAPLALSATTGNLTVTGAAGQILAGATPAFTATPTLGASGTLGTLTFGNATSGTITVSPVAGALGSVTVSLPAATDTLVGKATSDILTNKTIAGGSNTLSAIALSSLASQNNNTIVGNVSGSSASPIALTAAQVQTMTEQGAVLLNVLTGSASASLVDTTNITSSYNDYMITFDNVIPATDSVGLYCQVRSGGSFKSTSYLNQAGGVTTAIDLTSGSATVSNNSSGGVTGTMYLRHVNATTNFKFCDGRTYGLLASTGIGANNPAGYWNGGTGAVDGIQFLFSSGNIATGVIKIYGLRSAL